MADTLFMETTKIDPARTAAEIQARLVKHHAQAVLTEYANSQPEAITFRMRIGEQDVPFRLPCRWQAINELLSARGRFMDTADREAKARRIAWRQILRWVEAQLAFIETNMVKVEEVFLPYIAMRGGQTFFERVEAEHFLMLTHQTEPASSDDSQSESPD